MSGFTPTNSWANAAKLAGRSDARQIRDVGDKLNLITGDRYSFLRLLGGSGMVDGKKITKQGLISSRAVKSLTPELYDWEAAPHQFRLTANASAAMDAGDSANLTLDTTAGIEVGDIINKVDQQAQARVTAVTSNTVIAVTCIYSASGSITWTLDANIKYIEKLGSAQSDGHQVGTGTNREPTNRTNNLQFHVHAFSQGLLQRNLSLYSSGGNDGKQERKRLIMDMQRSREMTMLFGRLSDTGSGSTRVLTANGLEGLAGTVFNNAAAGGELVWSDFANLLMEAARSGGGSNEVMGICGTKVLNALSSYSQSQKRVTDSSKEYRANTTVLETPGGTLTLLGSEAMNSDARAGQMITFQPDLLERCYLQNVDMQVISGKSLGNELADREALVVCETLLASNPKAITLHTNILK